MNKPDQTDTRFKYLTAEDLLELSPDEYCETQFWDGEKWQTIYKLYHGNPQAVPHRILKPFE